MIPLLDFLAAYYPRYVFPPCLAKVMGEEENRDPNVARHDDDAVPAAGSGRLLGLRHHD